MANENYIRIAIILLFAIAFTTVGWVAPVLYASHVPSDSIVDVHEFSAENTTVNSESHYVCFDRTVKYDTSARVFTELYLVNGENTRVEVDSSAMNRYLQEGDTRVVSRFGLPDNLVPGEYKYILVIQMNMADGRVTRDLVFTSDSFYVVDGPPEPVGNHATC